MKRSPKVNLATAIAIPSTALQEPSKTRGMKQMKLSVRDFAALAFYAVSFAGIILINRYFGALI